jgi:hypothetical protein
MTMQKQQIKQAPKWFPENTEAMKAGQSYSSIS